MEAPKAVQDTPDLPGEKWGNVASCSLHQAGCPPKHDDGFESPPADWESKGIEVHDWNGPDDPENPFNWSFKYKWFITVTVCFISILTGLPAGSYGSGGDYISEQFHVQNAPFQNITWATVSWNMGAAIFPLLFVPLTETSGRMPGYFIAYIVFEIFLFPSAFAQNYATLVVTRFFGGGASSVSINIVGGSIADLWKGNKARSLPMSLFGFTSVAGIALGPFVGAAIQNIHFSQPWRWIFYIQIIYNGALIPVFYLILKETRGDVILAKRAKRLRRENPSRQVYARSELAQSSLLERMRVSFGRPTRMLTTEPVVIFFTLWVSFAWGILFLFFSSVTQTYTAIYHFTPWHSALVQLAITAGALLGTLLNPLADHLYLASAPRNPQHPGLPIPEARLYTALPGSLLFTAGLFTYGWASAPHTPWIAPTIGIAAVGLGIYSIYMAVVNYLTDAYEKFSASALAAASLGRNAFGAFLPLASAALFRNLGAGPAASVLGAIGLVLSLVPIVLLLQGPRIRARSPFMLEATFSPDEAERRSVAQSRAGSRRASGAV